MGLGKFRNRRCVCGSNKKYKDCHWQAMYKANLPKYDFTMAVLRRQNLKKKDYSKPIQTI